MSMRKILSLVSLLSMLATACGDELFTEPNPAYGTQERVDAIARTHQWQPVCQWKTPCPYQVGPTDAGASDAK